MGLNEKGLEGMEKAESAGSELKYTPSSAELKRSKNNTILSPQPSDDPRDPLVRAHLSLSSYSYTTNRLLPELAAIKEDWHSCRLVCGRLCSLRLAACRSACVNSASKAIRQTGQRDRLWCMYHISHLALPSFVLQC